MKLFRFELRKLLLNKKTLITSAVLLALYCVVGVGLSIASFGGLENYSVYSELANAVTGPYNAEQAELSNIAYEAAKERWGTDEGVTKLSSQDPQLKFDKAYYDYTVTVDEYWNGPILGQDVDNITGIYPLQQQLAELTAAGATDSYDYQRYSAQLETELAAGEPEFQNAALWESLFGVWGGVMAVILLFFPISFIIAPVFTNENTTGMDNIILSSKKGQGQIVAAKVGAVSVTCVIIALIYFAGTFIGTFLPFGTLAGAGLPIRSVLTASQISMSIGSFAALTVVWTIFVAIVYGAVLTLISSKLKSQAATFGIGIVILLGNVMISALGTTVEDTLSMLIDFGFMNTANASAIFGGLTSFHVFGSVVPYYIMALVILLVIGIIALFGVRISQKYRTVA